MMQMLDKGGIPIVTDEVRTADLDNPRGYYEFEKVKQLKHDASWLPQTRGMAIKMVSQLLYDLPSTEAYRIVFMERNLEEVLQSQEKMLQRLGRPAIPRDQMKRSYEQHLTRLADWLTHQRHMVVLYVSYNQLLQHPHHDAQRVQRFLDDRPDAQQMAQSVDPALYRNQQSSP